VKAASHQTTLESIGAHALGALTPCEAAALEAHLAVCPAGQHESRAYQALGDGLLHAVAERTPPARVRAGLIAALGEQRRGAPAPRRFSFARAGALAGLVLVVGVSLGLISQVIALRLQVNALGDQLRTNQTALALVAYPGARSLPVEGENAGGTIVIDNDQRVGVLIAWGLPPLEGSRAYQIWLVAPDGTRTSGGTFAVTRAMPYTSVVFRAEAPMSSFRGLGVTIEPTGGSPAPTGPRVLRADF
jgi:anti-sigma factor RsiW